MQSIRIGREGLLVTGAILALIFTGACAGDPSAGGSVSTAVGGDDAASPAKRDAADASAPGFTLESLAGQSVSLSDSSGEIRLVDFWATWCAPCREEIPMLNELQASYRDRGFRILAISDEEPQAIRDFVEEYGVEYTNLIGTGEVVDAYGVLGLPAAYLIDGDGKVIDTFLGPKPRSVLVKKIEALLDSLPAT